MEDQKILLQKIVEGIQEKKGKKIITADLSAIDSASAEYFIICEGGSTMQVSAISKFTMDRFGLRKYLCSRFSS